MIVNNNFEKDPSGFEDPLTGKIILTDSSLKEISESLKNGPPFTIQRVAELLVGPNDQYPRQFVHKYLRALSSIVSVGSRLDDYPNLEIDEEVFLNKTHNSVDSDGPNVILSEISWVIDTGLPEAMRPHENDQDFKLSHRNEENLETNENREP